MTEKKKREEEIGDANAEVVDMPEAEGTKTLEQIETLKHQLEEAEARLADSVEGWQRAQAEFQNYKKRVERDNELVYASMKGDIVKKILPILDDLERAMQKRPDGNTWADGIELIVRKLQTILDVEGVKRIEAAGTEFDPKFHEAISHEPAEDVASGYVIEVVQNGYMFGERVIRPALVRVAQ